MERLMSEGRKLIIPSILLLRVILRQYGETLNFDIETMNVNVLFVMFKINIVFLTYIHNVSNQNLHKLLHILTEGQLDLVFRSLYLKSTDLFHHTNRKNEGFNQAQYVLQDLVIVKNVVKKVEQTCL